MENLEDNFNSAAEEAEAKVEEAAEAAEEEVSEITNDTEELSEEIPADSADDAPEIPDEITEAAEEAEETTDEEAVSESEAAPDTEAEEIVEEEKPAKHGWTWVTTLVVVIAGVIILALAFLVLWTVDIGGTGTPPLKQLWENIRPKTQSECTIGDYSTIEVASSDVEVTDDVVESYISSTIGDDVTDEAVQEYSASHSDCDAQTVEEFEEYAQDYVYTYYLHNAIMSYLKGITEVKSYGEEDEAMLKEYAAEEMDYYASSYGIDADTLASYYGYTSAEEYEEAEAHDYMTTAMILDKIAKDLNITFSDEDLDADMQQYLDDYGYSTAYSLDEFKENVGDAWVYLYNNLTYKFDIVMTALEPNVVIVESTETDTEETTAAE